MLADFDLECGKVGLQLNLNKTMLMKNELVPDVPFALNGTNISECSSYVYLGRELNMRNDLVPELRRRKRAAWNAFKSVKEMVKRMKNLQLRTHLFDSTILPALTYASETWALCKQDENANSGIPKRNRKSYAWSITFQSSERRNPEFRPPSMIKNQGRCLVRQGIENQMDT